MSLDQRPSGTNRAMRAAAITTPHDTPRHTVEKIGGSSMSRTADLLDTGLSGGRCVGDRSDRPESESCKWSAPLSLRGL
ncbi:MAG: hypothetical protein U1D06_12375 [Paracoccaceae bacterium]|nr:hypothetical protein [Paracoccaceae bacterium]